MAGENGWIVRCNRYTCQVVDAFLPAFLRGAGFINYNLGENDVGVLVMTQLKIHAN